MNCAQAARIAERSMPRLSPPRSRQKGAAAPASFFVVESISSPPSYASFRLICASTTSRSSVASGPSTVAPPLAQAWVWPR
jgi:hypothetical protein